MLRFIFCIAISSCLHKAISVGYNDKTSKSGSECIHCRVSLPDNKKNTSYEISEKEISKSTKDIPIIESFDSTLWRNQTQLYSIIPSNFTLKRNLTKDIVSNVTLPFCMNSQHLNELRTLTLLMTKLSNKLHNDLNSLLSSSHCSTNICVECDCTGANKKLILAYTDLSQNSGKKNTKRKILKAINGLKNLLLHLGPTYLDKKEFDWNNFKNRCIKDFVKTSDIYSNEFSGNQNVEFFELLRQLQRSIVLIESNIELKSALNKTLSSTFSVAMALADGIPNSREFCQKLFSSQFDKRSSLLETTYLSKLHMEIIELPQCADRKLFAKNIRSKGLVSKIENDTSFEFDESMDFKNKPIVNVDRKTKNFHESTTTQKPNYTESKLILKTFKSLKSIISQNKTRRLIDYEADEAQGKVRKRETDLEPEPNDPLYGLQWALHKSSLASLNLIDVWPNFQIFYDLPPVVVAVIDSGIDFTHSDLTGKIWTNKDEIPNNGIDDDNNGYIDDVNGWDFVRGFPIPEDTYGHGTKVAGIIAATSNNSIGITSVCPFCEIMVLKVTCMTAKRPKTSTSTILKAIEYALGKRVKIANISKSGPDSKLLRLGLLEAQKADMIVVASAGNNGVNIDLKKNQVFPASYSISNLVTVASLNQLGKLASFSNYGVRSVDVSAPGGAIWTTNLEDGYACVSGTSYAAPQVAALLAFLWGLEPYLNHQYIIKNLIDRGTRLPSLRDKTRTGVAVNFFNIFFHIWSHPSLAEIRRRIAEGHPV